MADAPTLSPELARFLRAHVRSVAHVEALLLLRQLAPSPLPVSAVAASLYTDQRRAAESVAHLASVGLLAADEAGGYRYAPSAELAREVDALAEAYRTQLVPITLYVHALQEAAPLRDFADAFRLRKG